MTKTLSMFAILAAWAYLSPTTACGGTFTAAYYFGDSLSDTGNLYDLRGIHPSPPYFEGRASNGPVWPEHFAAEYDLPFPAPSRLGGPNYAYSGAQTGYGTSTIDASVPNVGEQIAEFRSSRGTLRETDLIVVWAGHNDITGGIPASVTGRNLAEHIAEIYDLGGRRFLFGNFAGAGSSAYNMALGRAVGAARTLEGFKHAFLDFNAFGRDVLSNPSQFGILHTSGMACTECTLAAAIDPNFMSSSGGVVPNPNSYLFWDAIQHPTAGVHEHLAQRAILAAERLSVTVVPEPRSVVLFAVLLSALRWRRHRIGRN